ncbi:MAG: GNAT family N-acetyltransferase [Clostridia bacterium]|nr:GNAT family N-acetyltransferase [Clostridia bacterium]
MELRKLTINDKTEFTKCLNEQVVLGGAIKGVRYEDGLDYEKFLEKLVEYENIPFTSYEQEDYQSVQFVLVNEDKIVGAVIIRPYLTKTLFEEYEGNIGYFVSPSERGKGYATTALKLAIEEFKKLNPTAKEVIACCYKENIPSKRVIEKCGGILIEELTGLVTPQKYLIKL